MIGIFPIVSEQPERLVAGFNDKHLDFRIVVDVATSGDARQVTATTLVHDAQLARPDLSRRHHAVSSADRPALLRQVAG